MLKMQNCVYNLKQMLLATETILQTCTNYQSIRGIRHRKPMWKGTAKSKLFRVPPRIKIPVEEYEELKRLHNNYRTQTKSLRQYLTNRYNIKFQASLDPKLIEKTFLEDLAKCNTINDEWNSQVKITREKRVAKELEEQIAFAKSRLALETRKKEEQLVFVEEIVRKEKELVHTFITPEKLEEAIEKAIANPVDYNYAIDLNGNKIVGRETTPQETKTETTIKN